MKRCTGPCGLSKPLFEFYERRGLGDGYQSQCKVCSIARLRGIDAADPANKGLRQQRYLDGLSPEQRAQRNEREREWWRRTRNVPPDRFRRLRTQPETLPREYLPAAPFGQWLRDYHERPGALSNVALARAAACHEKLLRTVSSGAALRVSYDIVDRVLIAANAQPEWDDIYPLDVAA